ncbi:MAG: hypothetical protein LUF34_03425 [Lachnospiraceae bacterium]|nr:hypothetical protein [Lachnospiraceae bacterium]
MKKKFFDINLYRDAIRQTRMIGLLYTLILSLEAVLVPIGSVLSIQSMDYAEYTASSVGLWDMHPLVVLTFCAMAPLLTLQMFDFLTKRNASDFYHSIPQTRTCLFVSFTAAALTWSLLAQWGTTILAMAVHGCFPAYFSVVVRSTLTISVQISAGILFVVGAALLAVTLTGTYFTNFVVTLLIIFVPRGLMLVVQQAVGSTLTIVNSDRYLTFLGNGWNVVTGGIFGLFFSSETSVFLNFRAGAYTAALGILYMIIACVLFNRRKSETAGEAAVHPKVQLFFRLIPALVISLIPDVLIFTFMAEQESVNSEDIYIFFIFYLVAVLTYFLYELISTRKIKNLVKAVPGLAVLLAVNLLLIFGMYGMQRSVLSYCPEAEEIDSVSVGSESVYVWGASFSEEYDGYLTSRASEILLTDTETKELIATRLAESIAYDSSSEVRESTTTAYSSREIAIRVNGRTTYRYIHFSQSDIRNLAEKLLANDAMQDIYMNLPDSGDTNLSLYCDSLGNAGAKKVYEALQEDIAEMGFTEWYSYCTNVSYTTYYANLSMVYTEDGRKTAENFVISDVTPRAAAAWREALWETEDQTSQRQQLVTMLQTLYDRILAEDDIEISYAYCEMLLGSAGQEAEASYVIGGEGATGAGEAYYSIEDFTGEQVAALLALAESQQNVALSGEDGYIHLYMTLEYYLTEEETEEAYEETYTEGATEVVSFDTLNGLYVDVYLAIPEDFDTALWASLADET